MPLRILSALALCWALAIAQDGLPFDREREAYRIYSLLMQKPPTSHGPDENPRYLIRAQTRVEQDRPCVQPPASRTAEFAEVLADFESRRKLARVLKREFALSKPYELLNEEQVKAFQSERGWPKPKPTDPDPHFVGVTDLFSFSDVYFSRNGRLALVLISSWCNGLCGLWQWKVLEKGPAGEWSELPSWVNCLTVAQRHEGLAGSRRLFRLSWKWRERSPVQITENA